MCTCPAFATLPHINLRAVKLRSQLGSMTAGDFPPSCAWKWSTNLKVLSSDTCANLSRDWAQCLGSGCKHDGCYTGASCVKDYLGGQHQVERKKNANKLWSHCSSKIWKEYMISVFEIAQGETSGLCGFRNRAIYDCVQLRVKVFRHKLCDQGRESWRQLRRLEHAGISCRDGPYLLRP